MSDIYDKLLEKTNSETVQLAGSFKELIGKELVLGQTRYQCRYGTLSDGHEKLTDSQRYYQAIREMHYIASNMRTVRAQVMICQGNIMGYEKSLEVARREKDLPNILRNEGLLLLEKEKQLQFLITVEDQTRMIDEYNNIRLELQDKVRATYPLGIEQAEEDHGKAIFEYRAMKGDQRVANIPLPPEVKAQLGIKFSNVEAMAPLALTDNKKFEQLTQNHRYLLDNKEK